MALCLAAPPLPFHSRQHMQRVIGIVLVAAGAVLGWQAWQSSQSLTGQFNDLLGGGPSPQTLAMGGAAAVALLVGGYLVLRGR